MTFTRQEVLNSLERLRNTMQKGWCKRHFAKDKNGHSVNAEDPNACEWCISGGLVRQEYDEEITRALRGHVQNWLTLVVQPDYGYSSIVAFNDALHTTKPDVLRLIDITIARVYDKKTGWADASS